MKKNTISSNPMLQNTPEKCWKTAPADDVTCASLKRKLQI